MTRASTPPRQRARRLVRALALLARGASGLAVLAALALGSALMLTPGGLPHRLPDEDALGTPAKATIVAPRAYDVVDEDATRAAREVAVAAERPVYAWDDGAAEEAVARVRSSFALVRETLERPPPWPGEARRDDDARRLAGAERDAFEARLGVPVGDADFAALAALGFSAALEGELVALVGPALSGYVVEDPKSLAAERDLERGLVARAVRGGTPGAERVLQDLSPVRSARAVREEAAVSAARLDVAAPARLALGHLAAALVRPTLAYDLPETARRRGEALDRVRPVVIHVRRGEHIVGEGDLIGRRDLLLFRSMRAQTRAVDVLAVRAGAAGLAALLALLLWGFARRRRAEVRLTVKDAAVLAALLLATTGLSVAGVLAGDALHERFPRVASEAFLLLVPFAAGTLVVRSTLGAEVALLFAVASGALAGMAAGGAPAVLLHATSTGVVAAGLSPRIRDAAALVRVGVAVAVAGALLAAGSAPLAARPLSEALPAALAAALAGAALVPPLALAGLLALQRLYLTDLQLVRLASLNHPALKDLIIQAPGTYHHALVAGALAEGAARATRARPLLARVGAYYHDLGKLKNPGAFSENQRGEAGAAGPTPAAGAAVIRRHVADGLDLARRWRLPREVADIIQQHHGTRRVASCWSRAQARAREAGDESLDDAPYRYQGPTPRSREAALVMMADTCEASARALADPDERALRALVDRRVAEIFAERQLEACDLSLRELADAAAAIANGLVALHGEAARRGGGSGETPDVRPLQLLARPHQS